MNVTVKNKGMRIHVQSLLQLGSGMHNITNDKRVSRLNSNSVMYNGLPSISLLDTVRVIEACGALGVDISSLHDTKNPSGIHIGIF